MFSTLQILYIRTALCLLICAPGFIASGQCPNGTSGTQLVANSNFNAGNTGFTSGYVYTANNTTEGQYYVGTRAQALAWNPGVTIKGDHTTGTGSFLMVNGYPAANVDAWCETITVSPNTEYIFSFWITSISCCSPAVLQFFFNGIALDTTMTAPPDTGWVQFSTGWNSGSNTSVSICIQDQNIGRASNDFGLDDISFMACSCNSLASGGTIAAVPDTVCSGDSTHLSVSGSTGTIQWQLSADGNTFTNIPGDTLAGYTTAAILQTTYYRVMAVTGCSADSSAIKTVGILPQPVAGIVTAQPGTLCPGATALLSATGNTGTIQWQSSADGIAFTDIAGATTPLYSDTALYRSTYYRVIAITGCGADSSAAIKVSVNALPVPVVTAPDSIICTGDSTTVCTTQPFASYVWNTGDTLSCTTAKLAGEYWVIVTDVNGCTAISGQKNIATFPVTPTPVLSTTDSIFCTSDSTLISSSGHYSSYRWNNGDARPYTYATAAGEYWVIVTDVNGCTAISGQKNIATFPVTPTPVLSTTDSIFCTSDSTLISSSGHYSSYRWNNGDTRPYTYATAAGGYWVTVTDTNGCAAVSGHQQVAVYPVPAVSIVEEGNNLASFNAVVYQWFLNDRIITGATSPDYLAKQTGNYQVLVTDSSGCTELSNSTYLVVTGVEYLAGNNGVDIYPNPNSVGSWQLTVGNDLVGSVLEVYNDEGRLVMKSEVRSQKSELTANTWAKGVYYLRISNEKVSVVKKLVKL